MTTAQELQKRFHICMPLFMALGDEMRLSIIEVLTEEALDGRERPGPIEFERCGLNVNEITRRTSLSRPAISHHLKILKDAGLVGVRQEGTANYYYLTLRESNRKLMELGYRLEEFMY
ncbi:MAG: ArsR family transcriptional regulator [Clostridium sp.]|nr:ArsR family transcriptional regulator [Clostridium sp.]